MASSALFKISGGCMTQESEMWPKVTEVGGREGGFC